MKRYVFLILCLFMASLSAYAAGISFFHGSFAEAKAEAAKEHKLIFIDCFTTWCGPCNRMARDVFPTDEVGDFYNAHFICCKIDMEKGEGLTVAKDFNIKSYPTYLFLDANGSLEHRTLGSKPANVFIEDGKTAIDPLRNLHGLTERFTKGEKDTAMLRQLIAVSAYADPALSEKALSVYWGIVPQSLIIEKQNWDIFSDYENDINSEAFQYVVGHKSIFEGKYGSNFVDNVLYSKASTSIRTAADTKDNALFQKATVFLKPCGDKQINVPAGLNTLRFYRKTNQWDVYVASADAFLAKYGDNDEIYNTVAWEMVANSDDATVLNKALDYINKSMQKNKNYGNSDTWANILFKLKRYKEAEAASKESIELAKKEKLDYTSTQELLDKTEKSLASVGK